ncbi:MAG: glycosyltransferase [candidate division WOR-3 bacterium]
MKKLKVLHLNASTYIGGTEMMILRLLDNIDRTKFDVSVASFFPGGTLLDEVKKRGGKPFLFKIANQKNILQMFNAFIRLYQYLRNNNIDIIHIYGFWSNIIGRFCARLANVPIIITGQRTEDNWRKSFHSLLDRFTSRWVNLYISVFNKGKELLIKRDKIPEKKIVVIHNGIDLNWAIGGKGNSLFPIVGMVAAFSSFKAHEVLIESAIKIVEKLPKIKFILVGCGPKQKKITELINKRGLNSYFLLPGFVYDVRPILSILSVFVLVSYSEGLPVAVMEAMSFGLPVVASKVGGIPELIEDKVTGMLVEPNNPEKLASAIIELLENPEKASIMGKKAREKIITDFSIRKMTNKIEFYYTNLAMRKRIV